MSKYKNNLGFSLVEVLTVITIVVIGMLGLVSLVRQNIQVQNINKNYLIASMISQEGLELVRNVRDENWLNESVGWKDGVSTQGGNLSFIIEYDRAGDTISINPTVSNITDPDARLYIDGDGFYSHVDSADSTPFFRLVNVDSVYELDVKDYLIVSSKVQWEDRGKTYDYVSETYFYDWR